MAAPSPTSASELPRATSPGGDGDAPAGPVVLFDGVCNLCSAWVRFVVDRDPAGRFRFASLQSPLGRRLLGVHGLAVPEGDPSSIVLLEGGRVYQQSSAVLRVWAQLASPLRWLSVLRLVPRPLRDLVYRFVARNRYRWFGKAEACLVPTPELRARFLD